MNGTSKPSQSALIVGVGEGLGASLARCFAAQGFAVVMGARTPERLETLSAEIAASGQWATPYVMDARNERDLQDAVAVAEAVAPLQVAIYNAGAAHRSPAQDITAEMFEKVWRLGCLGGFCMARAAGERMLSRGRGTILFTSATSAWRGGAEFAAFAAAKSGLRAVSQSLAREWGPKGIHVASVVIDGPMDMPAIHRRFPNIRSAVPPDGLLDTGHVAEVYWQLHRQHRSAWTQEVDLRPYSEKF